MIDLTGKKFGELEVIERDVSHAKSKVHWICKCSCGKVLSINGESLKYGRSKTCGCSKIKHGDCRGYAKPRTYRSWECAKGRCTNPSDQAYSHYGARGIAFHKEWFDFRNFKRDMGECPPGKTLDRIDNSKGYGPDNCRWATSKEQSRNTRFNVIVEYNGKKYVFAELVEYLHENKLCLFNYQYIKKLYHDYGSVEKIIEHFKNSIWRHYGNQSI